MKRTRSIGILLALALVVAACHKNLTPETPKAASAMKADDVLVRVVELQATVIQFCGPEPECAPGTLPTATARQIVRGTVDMQKVLRSAPDGWLASVKVTYAQLKPRFAGLTN